MSKKWIMAILVLGIILAILLAVILYKKDDAQEGNMIGTEKLAEIKNEINNQNEIEEKENTNETIETSLVNTNISPNAIIIEKKYYKECDHLIRDVIDVPEDLVNKTEADAKEKYSDWHLEGYSPKEIVFSKEYSGYCDEHYVAREHNGVIGIYNVDENGVETLKEDTEISTQYLPEEDLENLKIGVSIVGDLNLYNFLEDYE